MEPFSDYGSFIGISITYRDPYLRVLGLACFYPTSAVVLQHGNYYIRDPHQRASGLAYFLPTTAVRPYEPHCNCFTMPLLGCLCLLEQIVVRAGGTSGAWSFGVVEIPPCPMQYTQPARADPYTCVPDVQLSSNSY